MRSMLRAERLHPFSVCHPIWMFPNSPGQKLGPLSQTRHPQGLGPCFSPDWGIPGDRDPVCLYHPTAPSPGPWKLKASEGQKSCPSLFSTTQLPRS